MLASFAATRPADHLLLTGGGNVVPGLTTAGGTRTVTPQATYILDPSTGTAHPAVEPGGAGGGTAASTAPAKSRTALYVVGGVVVFGVVGLAIWLGRRS